METVTITEAQKRTGLTTKQIRDRIIRGEISATRSDKGGKRAPWLIDSTTLPARENVSQVSPASESPVKLKNMLTAMQIKKIQQSLESGRGKIVADHKAECEAKAIEAITHFIGFIKRKMKLTKNQQTTWNKEIDKFAANYGI